MAKRVPPQPITDQDDPNYDPFDPDLIPAKKLSTLADLIPDDRNANAGTERGRAMVETSLGLYGAGRSTLVDKHGKLIAGNKTAEAWGSIANPEDVIIVPTDGTKLVVVQRTDLDMEIDPAARALGIMDNRASEVGLKWDSYNLAALGAEIDLAPMFTHEEVQAIVSSGLVKIDLEEPPEASEEPEEPDLGPGGYEVSIRLSEAQGNDAELLSALKAVCRAYSLTFEVKAL